MLPPVSAGELVIEVDNDYLANNLENDDLYTFGLSLAWEWDKGRVGLHENSFTDKQADTRFDETYVTYGKRMDLGKKWTAYLDAGVVHLGKGLLGSSLQNSLHRILGNSAVHLTYIPYSKVQPVGFFELRRASTSDDDTFSHGPRFELQVAEFKSMLLGVWEVEWNPSSQWSFGVAYGTRHVQTDLNPLVSWSIEHGHYEEVTASFKDKFFVTWTYNRYGTKRAHVAFGYRNH